MYGSYAPQGFPQKSAGRIISTYRRSRNVDKGRRTSKPIQSWQYTKDVFLYLRSNPLACFVIREWCRSHVVRARIISYFSLSLSLSVSLPLLSVSISFSVCLYRFFCLCLSLLYLLSLSIIMFLSFCKVDWCHLLPK